MKYNFKLIIGFFVLLYIVLTVLFFAFYRELAFKDVKKEAMYILDTMNAIRDYIVTVQRPLIDELKTNKKLDNDFYDPRLLSASCITQEIYKIQLAKKNINYEYKLTALNPINPDNSANEMEMKILDSFRSGESKYNFSVINEKNKKYFFVSVPTGKNLPSCIKCHNQENAPKEIVQKYGNITDIEEHLGDVTAMISLKVPVTSILSYHMREFFIGGVTVFIVFAIFILLIYVIYKKDMRLKDRQEQLLLSQNRLASMGEMIGNISHQWKQPLAQIVSILTNIELYSERDRLTKDRLSLKIKEANEQIVFMSNTINDFKNFFLPNKEQKIFLINSAIRDSERLLGASLKQNAIQLQIDIRENFHISGFNNEMIQVLINIINNAKEAFLFNNIKDRLIKISAFMENGSKIITIESNTNPIEEEIMDKIFEPYVTTKESGSGLGLYISKMIIEKNKGSIKVKNLNNGVMFIIVF